MSGGGVTVGVEEEFLVVAPGSGQPVGLGAKVARAVRGGDAGLDVQLELSPAQVESATGVCHDLLELREQLVHGRALLAQAAEEAGGRLAAVGMPPVGDVPPTTSDNPRYREIGRRYGALARGSGLCGCHVHVGVPSTDVAVRVSNFVRPWLPTLLTITANSPFFHGGETGYASWRWLQWARWPLAGPPPYFESLDEYRSLVDTIIDCEVIMDEAMIYWYVRPSAHVPTLEVRIADVAATVDDAVLLAGLVRALVTRALEQLDAGEDAPRVPSELLRAACWQAARGGFEGPGIDPIHHGPTTGRVMVRQLVEHVYPALEALGDVGLVKALVARLEAHGAGADRQRRDFERAGDILHVVDGIVARTLG